MDIHKIDDYEIVKNFIISTYAFVQAGTQIITLLYNKYDKRYVMIIQMYVWHDYQYINHDGCEIKLYDEKNNQIEYMNILVQNLKKFIDNHILEKYYSITNDGKEPLLTIEDIEIGIKCQHLSLKKFFDNADEYLTDCVDRIRYYIDIHYNNTIEKVIETRYIIEILQNKDNTEQICNLDAIFKKYNIPKKDQIYIIDKYLNHVLIQYKNINNILGNITEYSQKLSIS